MCVTFIVLQVPHSQMFLLLFVSTQLFLKCDEYGFRNKRSADNEKMSPADSVPRETDERVRRFITTRAAPLAPFAAMNFSSHCMAGSMSLFTHLPEQMCSDSSVRKDNVDCWTGVSYGRCVL